MVMVLLHDDAAMLHAAKKHLSDHCSLFVLFAHDRLRKAPEWWMPCSYSRMSDRPQAEAKRLSQEEGHNDA
jgi:hypothetical protein